MYVSLGHLTDYGPKVYGYLWSQGFAFDLFDAIKKEGLLNSVVGKRYAQHIIGQGGQIDPMEEFLGRKPNQDVFLRDSDL